MWLGGIESDEQWSLELSYCAAVLSEEFMKKIRSPTWEINYGNTVLGISWRHLPP